MLNVYRETAFKSNTATPVISDGRAGIAGGSAAIGVMPAADPDGTVAPATPAIPGPAAVRAILILAAESAFELQEGTENSQFLTQLTERSENLAQTLAALPDVSHGADCTLMLRRARQAVDVLNEAIRRDVLDNIDENTGARELKATLQSLRDIAVEAGRALAHLTIRDSGSR